MDENNNLTVAISGDDAIIGTDVFLSNGDTAHAQVMKVAWGSDSTVTRATEQTPLPVKVFGLTGPLGTVTVTGAVRGLGTFNVGNTSGSAIHVTGGVNAFVYGVTGATPVAVTGSVSILSSVGITGVVNVTGGRYLNSATDSIMVSGTLAKSWNLTNANDNITVYGVGGATFLSSKIMGSDGTIIGNSGGALNVNVIGAGISATVNVGTVIGVQNATGSVLRIEGTAGGTPVPVSGTVAISGTPTVNITNNPLEVDLIDPFIAQYPSITPTTSNNYEKMFTGQIGNTAYTIPWFLNELMREIGLSGGAGIARRVNELVTDGQSSRISPFIGVRTFNHTTGVLKTRRINLDDTIKELDPITSPLSNAANHGVTIKNIGNTKVTLGASVILGFGYTAPTNPNDFGIHLDLSESIFIPSRLRIAQSGSSVISLYGRVDFSEAAGSTGTVAIMAV